MIKTSADKLQDLFLKAKVREAEDVKRDEERDREMGVARRAIAAIPKPSVAAAIDDGWDGIGDLISQALGDGAWQRAVNSVPDEWEEDEALGAFEDVLNAPSTSDFIWLLLSPRSGDA